MDSLKLRLVSTAHLGLCQKHLLLLFYYLWVFLTKLNWWSFWNLLDCKSRQVSMTLLSILVDLNNTVVGTISILSLFSNSSNLLSKCLGTVPGSPSTIVIIIIFMFYSFFSAFREKIVKIQEFVFLLFSFYRQLEQHNPEDDEFFSGSSSSSCHAGSTDIPDPLSPLLPIVHRPRQVFRTTSRILT